MAVEPISLGVGTALATIGLLASFKGAVDGYLLLESFFGKDNGLLDLAIRYHVQLKVLEVWGSRCNIEDDDLSKCALSELPKETQDVILTVLARIKTLHEECRDFLNYHDGNDILGSLAGSVKELKVDGAEVSALSQKQKDDRRKAKKAIKWTIKNKDRFTEIVDKLERYNNDLLKFLSPHLTQTFNIILPSYTLAGISDRETVDRLQGLEEKYFLTSHAAKLKALQGSTQGYRPVTILRKDEIKLSTQLHSGKASLDSREFGHYQAVRKIWVEWRYLEANLTATDKAKIRERINTLGAMLSAVSTPDLRIPPFLGIFEDDSQALQGGQIRRGFTYGAPQGHSTSSPISLLSMIEKYKDMKEPVLGDKFRLAATLATSLDLLHSSQWLHKAFRSDNILFFPNRQVSPSRNSITQISILDPWITGFEYARLSNADSIGYRPDGTKHVDYYYHPDVTNGFTKALDLYSLGVILLEIAMWRPLSSKIPQEKRNDLAGIRDGFVDFAEKQLGAMMGSVYADVVLLCLGMGLEGLDEADLACEVSNNIIAKLQYCRA